ncbi:MAG: restriction endonuclease subunit S, partial [Aeriscardovia sp.]|nr:restriction endonuclease subunit S [Aeriscardovia sp.]
DEQRKIASFLQRIDEQMTVYQKQFEELKQLKSACLETMFPQEEENVPAIRFEGFDKNWYKAKASELYETYNERNHPELPVLSACQDIRGMAVRSESGYDISHDRANEVTYKVVKPGQFVIHLRSFQGGFAHSAVEGITSPAYTVFGFKEPEKHDDYFWKTIFMSKDFINRLKTITYGIRDGRSISFSEFGDMELTFPEGEEQHRIASFFHSIDTQIAVQQQNLERLKQMKQSCLGLLFPDNQSITPPSDSRDLTENG